MNELITHELLKTEFTEAFLRVWDASIGIPLEPNSDSTHVEMNKDWIAAVVWLGGEWTGNVTISLSKKFARQIAARMLECDLDDVSDEDYKDAVKELANMSAGNLKSVLPGPCGLATPGCFEGDAPHNSIPEFTTVITLSYLCESAPVIVTLEGLH